MGEGILRFYRTKIKAEYRIAFIATFFIALFIHLYKFTNTLPNHDSIYNYYSDQNVLGSGRWAVSLACGISSYWDLPWIIGLFSCVFISLTAIVIVMLFQIDNPILIGLTGALLAASPATTETFFFLYTADGYMIAMCLAALAVYLSRIEETRKARLFLSGLCICISCGIYQAYVSFALLLAICYLIDSLLQNKHSKQDCLRWILRQAMIYIASLAAYYAIWKVCMYFSGTVANNYQGISEVGKLSVGLLANGLLRSIKTVILYFLQYDILSHGFNLYSVLSVLFLLVFAVGLLISSFKSGIWGRKWAVILLAICLVAIIPFSCIWFFTSASVEYRPMMLQSLTVLFVLTALLYERWAISAAKNAVCLFLILTVFSNALMANVCYFYMHYCYERTYAEGVEMMSEIHDLQDVYEFDKIAVVGTRIYDVQFVNFDTETGMRTNTGEIHILSVYLEKTLLFDSDRTTKYLYATFGLDLEVVDDMQMNELLANKEVQDMGCWPAGNSIGVVDDILVIKLSGENEAE